MDRSNDAPLPPAELLAASLWASEARFRNIIEKNADGVVVVSVDGVIRYVNPAAVRLLGRTADDLRGQVFGVPIIPGETTEVDVVLAAGDARVAELRVVETEWEGEPALLASLRDVSERKQLEEQLRQKVEALAEADRRKDEFLAMLAHELRNPLAPIQNAVHVLRLRGDDPHLREQMRALLDQQTRIIARLVDDLLDVSRVTRGKIQLRPETVDLAAVVGRAVETTRPLIEARGHQLSVALPAAPVRLLADPVRLEQIVVNLLNNATKYTDPGGAISLEARLAGAEVVLRVRDTGIGIAPEFLPHVFDLFSQDGRALDRSQGGLGIGLTLVRSLAELHGGSVQAASAGRGQGSEFVVRLPLLARPPVPVPPAPEPTPPPGRARRVLVIDDNLASADSLAQIVRLWGHRTHTAQSGREALEVARAFLPEVILLDIAMPGMDGYDVARRLRRTPGLEHARLIAMTGYGRDEDRLRAFEAGFDHHLVKPIDVDALEGLFTTS